MQYTNIILIAIIQGITEFLPISSSAHLIILSNILNIQNNIHLDIFSHIGSLLATILFYKKDIFIISKGNFKNPLFNKIILSTIPIIIVGIIVYLFKIDFRNPRIIIYTSILFGILFHIANKINKSTKTINNITKMQSFLIGIIQTLSILPGTSRSGITTTGLLFFNINRKDALKFSFLISIPTIILISTADIFAIIKDNITINIIEVISTLILSFTFSLISIKTINKFSNNISFKIFAFYRIILGIILFFFIK